MLGKSKVLLTVDPCPRSITRWAGQQWLFKPGLCSVHCQGSHRSPTRPASASLSRILSVPVGLSVCDLCPECCLFPSNPLLAVITEATGSRRELRCGGMLLLRPKEHGRRRSKLTLHSHLLVFYDKTRLKFLNLLENVAFFTLRNG